MIHSMTAFARRDSQGEWGTFTLELRSVNHRYLELALRLPEEVRALEPRIRDKINQTLGRGKVDCNLRYQAPLQGGALEFDHDLVGKLAHVSREIDGIVYNPAPINAFDILRWPGVLQLPVPEPEQLHAAALAEIKRLRAPPPVRGLGLGRRLLTDLETHAAANRVRTPRLETNRALRPGKEGGVVDPPGAVRLDVGIDPGGHLMHLGPPRDGDITAQAAHQDSLPVPCGHRR